MESSPSCSFSHGRAPPQCLSRDDYIELRNSQDKLLNAEFTSIHQSIRRLEEKTDRLEEKTDRLEEKTDRLEAEMRQLHAHSRNNALRNPTLPIRPVVVYHPERGILEPEPSHFPRNANEFYCLRDPPSDRHRSMLAYLALFYDVQLRTAEHPSDDGNSDDEIFLDQPDLIVEKLEGILGLHEHKFVKFRERARQLASRITPKPIKRSQIMLPNETYLPDSRRPRLELRPIGAGDKRRYNGAPDSTSSENLTNARLEWGTRSTPSAQRPRIRCSSDERADVPRPRKLEFKRPKPVSEKSGSETTDSDSQTRAFTSPREP
ncbi:WAC domain-containing protein [Colletotrichum tofieldiae]|uniref:WAC domain-containing protein n=1 Tax=Colletotrichum tofieldiae TaxID=708197 RepID=A0A166N6W3_9PEZI|nr:WAC domain-containing protein [Colletotrichum tofieldiae]